MFNYGVRGVMSMKYTEEMTDSAHIKQQYLDEFENLIAEKLKEAEKSRTEYVSEIFENPEKYRNELKNLIGWPLNEKREETIPDADYEEISDEGDFKIYRIKIEVMKGMHLQGLFFKKKDEKKRPLVLTLHGLLGSPELVAGFFEKDKGSYNDLISRVLRYDANVFAPQLLIWNITGGFRDYGVKLDRYSIDSKLKMTGSSAVAVEIYALKRTIDFFEKENYVTTIGMIGHSYGGFYTLHTAALDERIKASVCNSYFSNFTKVLMPDWSWRDSAYKFCNAEVASLVYPRKLFLQMGTNDVLFDSKDTEKEFERLKMLCADKGTDWTKLIIFEGIHEFNKDDIAIKLLMDELRS